MVLMKIKSFFKKAYSWLSDSQLIFRIPICFIHNIESVKHFDFILFQLEVSDFNVRSDMFLFGRLRNDHKSSVDCPSQGYLMRLFRILFSQFYNVFVLHQSVIVSGKWSVCNQRYPIVLAALNGIFLDVEWMNLYLIHNRHFFNLRDHCVQMVGEEV